MVTTLMPVPKQQYFGIAGLPLIAGKIYTYKAGTNVLKDTYTDAAGTVKQPNPIPLNARGESASPIFWSGAYKVEVRDALDNVVYTVDNYNTDPAGLWGIFDMLQAGDGASKFGFIQAGAGAVKRTGLDKMRDSVDWIDYKQPDDVDDTASLNRALATGAGRIKFRGNKNIGGHVTFSGPVILSGDGRNSQISFTAADAWFKIKGTTDAIAQGIEFEGLTFTAAGFETVPHIFMDWARQIKYERCFIYHCPISANHMNFWNITSCEVYDSDILVQHTRDQGEANEVSGAPRCTASYFSNSLIDLVDCVDFMAVNCHFFQKGVRSRLVNLKNEGGDPAQQPKSTYWISNNVFDSVYGLSLDLWDVAGCSIMGNWFSGGRDLHTDGAYIYRGWHNKIVGNTFMYCGAWGLALESCEETIVTSNTFAGNQSGGMRTSGTCKGIIISTNNFGCNPAIYGAPYVIQPVGYSDTGGASSRVRVTANLFRPGDMAIPLYLPVTYENRNFVRDNEGASDILAYGYTGTTAQRPTDRPPGFGPYFDATIGKPVWWSGASWLDAAGVAV